MCSIGIIPILAACLIVAGNYYFQQRLNPRLRASEDLKKLLYDLLPLAAEYWASDLKNRKEDRKRCEARILAAKLTVSIQCRHMSLHSRKLKEWYNNIQQSRLDLMDALTGGCFQQALWQSDPQRVNRAAKEISYIVSALIRAT